MFDDILSKTTFLWILDSVNAVMYEKHKPHRHLQIAM